MEVVSKITEKNNRFDNFKILFFYYYYNWSTYLKNMELKFWKNTLHH